MRWIGVVGDADELLDKVVGSVQQRKRNVLTRTGKMRKESRLNSVKLVKRKIQISYNYNKSCFNSLGNSLFKASYIMVFIYIK